MQLQSALPIVRALADGINPLTGETFNDESPYSEPRTLRALFSAVELMEREVEREKRRERRRCPPRPRMTINEPFPADWVGLQHGDIEAEGGRG